MDPNPEDRVLLRTLPLSNGNYGGILQAYALQRVLIDIGLHPATDLSISRPLSRFSKSLARLVVRTMPSWVFGTRATAEIRDSVLSEEISRPLAPFVTENVNTVRVYRKRGVIDDDVVKQYRKMVVGSDQVWRHRYGDVKSYLFDFVDDPNVRMISYAASFGRDDLDGYGDRLIRATKTLALRFDSVSVRESSAVEICKKYWDVTARHHVDPTMLLSRDHYTALAAAGDASDLSPQCLVYVLDESQAIRHRVDALCERLGLRETRLIAKPGSYADWRARPEEYRHPTVPTWLKAFADARFVVTDSFHGTIFAILNNTPFIAVSNAERGSSRFTSLLRTFDLQHRLLTPDSRDDVEDALRHEIDWQSVNERLAAKRDEGIDYLRGALLTAERGGRGA
jgi:hypothetical protein